MYVRSACPIGRDGADKCRYIYQSEGYKNVINFEKVTKTKLTKNI